MIPDEEKIKIPMSILWDDVSRRELQEEINKDIIQKILTVCKNMKTDEEKIKILSNLLNDCLETMNQEYSFKVRGIENNKFVVEFNIVEVPEDNYIGFAGY